jgi:hypothetical protein
MNSFNVRLKSSQKYKVSVTSGGVQVPARVEDLINFDTSNKQDKYLMMYDASTQTYKMVNPDEILINAVTEPEQPGLPQEFIDQLDIDLDNKIDLDAGTF